MRNIIMKRISSYLVVVLGLFLLVGCTNKIHQANCKIDLENENEGYTLKANYKLYYDKNEFNSNDIYDISKGTTKEDELFDYADILDYYKTRKKSHDYEKD